MKLILGSTSVFRQNQLKQLAIAFTAFGADIDEDEVKNSGLSPLDISRELSLKKAQKVLEHFPDDVIIGADQVLNFNGEIFSKPKTKEKAFIQLKKLQGSMHELITSYAVVTKDKTEINTVVSKMYMKELSDEQIKKYIDIDEPLHSCGSYKLETLGIALFDKIECPDHSAIIGLPLIALTKTLSHFSINIL